MNVRAWAQPLPVVTSTEDVEREFETRLQESSRLAFRVAFGVLRQREDAEDVAQEAFAKAYRSFHGLRDRERFRAWLVRMTWRLAIDRFRSNRRRAAHEQSVEVPPDARVDPDVEARDRHAHLWAAIDDLPEPLRIVTVLAAIEGHDLKEVSRLLDVPEGTIKWRLFTARKTLQEKLRWMTAGKD
jgi:RNA polymerase sigma-70 factor (ECF subfamily)